MTATAFDELMLSDVFDGLDLVLEALADVGDPASRLLGLAELDRLAVELRRLVAGGRAFVIASRAERFTARKAALDLDLSLSVVSAAMARAKQHPGWPNG